MSDNKNKNLRLDLPFSWFGGKRLISGITWDILTDFGRVDIAHYMDPTVGGASFLFTRPDYDPMRHTETVCDSDGLLVNALRSIRESPEETARVASRQVIHADLVAAKRKIIAERDGILQYLREDLSWHNSEIAGLWLWGVSTWIGASLECLASIPALGDKGHGVNKLSLVGDGTTEGVLKNITDWYRRLSDRLRRVRIVNGDWSSICGGNWQHRFGTVGITLDPPYCGDENDSRVYTDYDSSVAREMEKWAIERGSRKEYRIVMFGHSGDYPGLVEAGWKELLWNSSGGMSRSARSEEGGKKNHLNEAMYISPGCTFDWGRVIAKLSEKK